MGKRRERVRSMLVQYEGCPGRSQNCGTNVFDANKHKSWSNIRLEFDTS